MEQFSYRSGRVMQFVKRLQEDWLQCYSKNFDNNFILLLKTFITKAQEYKVSLKQKFKNVCVAMHSLVMSLCSCAFFVTSLYILTMAVNLQ